MSGFSGRLLSYLWIIVLWMIWFHFEERGTNNSSEVVVSLQVRFCCSLWCHIDAVCLHLVVKVGFICAYQLWYESNCQGIHGGKQKSFLSQVEVMNLSLQVLSMCFNMSVYSLSHIFNQIANQPQKICFKSQH